MTEDERHPLRWRALAVTQAAGFMALLDVSIVNVALPSIQRDLGASASAAQWVISGYSLAMGLALVPAGRLGDMLGRRRMFLIGLSAFVLTSALSGAASAMGVLVAARLLQGLAAGTLVPQNSGLIQELFQGAERGRAFGILGAAIGLATATGPVAGGLILTAFTGPDAWRWVFYVNVPIGLVTLVFAARVLPRPAGVRLRRTHLDVVGALLLGGGVFCLLLPLAYADSGGLRRWWWLLALSVLLLGAFARWESATARRGRQAMLDPRLGRTEGFAVGSIIGLVYFIAFTGVWLVLALFFQHGLGYSPLRSGLAVTPFAVAAAVSSAIAGRLVSRVGRWLTVYGLGMGVLGFAAAAMLLLHAPAGAALWWVAAPLALAGFGAGMVISPNITLTLQNVPTRMAGVAAGALQTAQRIGSAVGTALLSTVFYLGLGRHEGAYGAAVRDALMCTAGVMLLALVLAIVDLKRQPQPSSTKDMTEVV